jgi:hypothetical protein
MDSSTLRHQRVLTSWFDCGHLCRCPACCWFVQTPACEGRSSHLTRTWNFQLTSYVKLIDVWGRNEGLVLCVVLMTVGSIMMAATNSVQMYAAAEVFSQTG